MGKGKGGGKRGRVGEMMMVKVWGRLRVKRVGKVKRERVREMVRVSVKRKGRG